MRLHPFIAAFIWSKAKPTTVTHKDGSTVRVKRTLRKGMASRRLIAGGTYNETDYALHATKGYRVVGVGKGLSPFIGHRYEPALIERLYTGAVNAYYRVQAALAARPNLPAPSGVPTRQIIRAARRESAKRFARVGKIHATQQRLAA